MASDQGKRARMGQKARKQPGIYKSPGRWHFPETYPQGGKQGQPHLSTRYPHVIHKSTGYPQVIPRLRVTNVTVGVTDVLLTRSYPQLCPQM